MNDDSEPVVLRTAPLVEETPEGLRWLAMGSLIDGAPRYEAAPELESAMQQSKSTRKMTTIELFAGIAGFSSPHTYALAFVEKEPSCRAVIRRHYPSALILDDVRSCGAHNLPWANIIKFGFPCQDLSAAGNRAGLTGARSGLFYEAMRIVNELRPDYAVWENVPGLLSSDDGRDFARVLMELERVGYCGCWTTLDAQFFGVAQRRRRVFGVFARRDIGAARCAEILSLAPRLPWNTQKGGAERARVAATIRAGASGNGVNRPGRRGDDDVNIVAATPQSGGNGSIPSSRGENIVPWPAIALSNRGREGDVFETVRAGSHGALPMVFGGNNTSSERACDSALTAHPTGRYDFESDNFVCGALGAAQGGANDNSAQAGHIVVGSLQSHSKEHGHAMTTQQAVEAGHVLAFTERTRAEGRTFEAQEDLAYALTNPGSGGRTHSRQIAGGFGVRKLTPVECERLQGFPDDWTAWGVDESGDRIEMSDSQRYRMLGNAVCRRVSAWIDSQLVRHR